MGSLPTSLPLTRVFLAAQRAEIVESEFQLSDGKLVSLFSMFFLKRHKSVQLHSEFYFKSIIPQ